MSANNTLKTLGIFWLNNIGLYVQSRLPPDVESELLQQVMNLTPKLLSSLPPEQQQQQVIQLQQMLRRDQQQPSQKIPFMPQPSPLSAVIHCHVRSRSHTHTYTDIHNQYTTHSSPKDIVSSNSYEEMCESFAETGERVGRGETGKLCVHNWSSRETLAVPLHTIVARLCSNDVPLFPRWTNASWQSQVRLWSYSASFVPSSNSSFLWNTFPSLVDSNRILHPSTVTKFLHSSRCARWPTSDENPWFRLHQPRPYE